MFARRTPFVTAPPWSIVASRRILLEKGDLAPPPVAPRSGDLELPLPRRVHEIDAVDPICLEEQIVLDVPSMKLPAQGNRDCSEQRRGGSPGRCFPSTRS